jgi:methylmalonyl-CoA mutase
MRTYTPEPEIPVPPAGSHGPTLRSVARRGWRIVQPVHVDVAATPSAIQAVRDELDGGADGVRLTVPGSATPGDLHRLLSGLDLSGRVLSFAWGSPGLAAVALDALQGRPAPDAIHLGLDPASRLGSVGSLLGGTERRFATGAEVAVAAAESGSTVRTFTFDDQAWHHAGADASVALGIQLASGVAALRAMESEGLALADAFRAIAFRHTLPARFLYGIATIRAGQALWRRVAQLCGVDTEPHQTAATAFRAHTRCDPWVNILRATASTFAGIVGGANWVETPPYASGDDARRLARNTQLVLRDEAHLDRVADPAGGSDVIESLTGELARVAWMRFQEIEAAGGIAAALRDGALHRAIADSRGRLEAGVRTRSIPVLGVSRFPNLDEEAPSPAPEALEAALRPAPEAIANIDPAADFAGTQALVQTAPTLDALTQSRVGRGVERHAPLPLFRLAAPFEALRANDAASVFFATLGPLAEHTARTGFGRELVESGGLRAHIPDGVETPAQAVDAWRGAKSPQVVVVSSATKRFATDVADVVRQLTGAGAAVWVLGQPGEHEAALREAGARDFLFTGGDALSALADFWTEVSA